MSNTDIEAARNSFRVDATMSARDITEAIAGLASVVQKEADTATADGASGDDGGELQRRADALEGIVSELENITVEVDTECPVCAGEGTVGCDGGSQNSTCPGDESCPVCGGETTVQCTRCDGSGEVDEPIVTEEAAQEVAAAVADAFSRLP